GCAGINEENPHLNPPPEYRRRESRRRRGLSGLGFRLLLSSILQEVFLNGQADLALRKEEIPKQWYNVLADLPQPLAPPLHPGTKQPAGPQDLSAIFPMNI